MNRWERWNRVLQEKQEDELDSSLKDENEEEEEQSQNKKKEEDLEDQSTNIEGQSPFKHHLLKGKTPEEIEALFAAQEGALRETGRELTRVKSEKPKVEEEEEEEELTSEQLFAKPQTLVDTITKRVVKEMKGMIAPFEQEVKDRRVEGAWGELATQYPDYVDYKSRMDEILSQHNITEPNIVTLKSTYIMARGMASLDGDAPSSRRNEGEGRPRNRVNPQHPPSSHPVKQGNEGKNLRKLTESEKTVARMQGLNDEEYLKYLEMDEMEVSRAEAKK